MAIIIKLGRHCSVVGDVGSATVSTCRSRTIPLSGASTLLLQCYMYMYLKVVLLSRFLFGILGGILNSLTETNFSSRFRIE